MIFLRSKIYTITLGALAALAIFFCSNSVKGSVVMADNGPQIDINSVVMSVGHPIDINSWEKESYELYEHAKHYIPHDCYNTYGRFLREEFFELKLSKLNDINKETLIAAWLKVVKDGLSLRRYEGRFFYYQLEQRIKEELIKLKVDTYNFFWALNNDKSYFNLTVSSDKDYVRVCRYYVRGKYNKIPLSMFLGGDGVVGKEEEEEEVLDSDTYLKENTLHIHVITDIHKLKVLGSKNGAPIYLWIDNDANIDELEATGKVIFVLIGHAKDKYKDKKVVFSDKVEVIEIPDITK